MQKFKIFGENVQVTQGGNLLVRIGSLYKSAGMAFGFPKNSPGVSINRKIVERAEKEDRHIVIEIGERRYIIHPKRIRETVKTYGSVYRDKKVELYVLPVRELCPVGRET